jgi:hypothetical protein
MIRWKTTGENQKNKIMATFKIETGIAKGKTWKAVGINPKTGKQMTMQGRQKGTPRWYKKS